MSKFLRIFLIVALAALTVRCGKEEPAPVPGTEQAQPLREKPQLQAAVKAMAAEAPAVWESLNGIEVWQAGYLPSGAWLNGSAKTARHPMWSVTKTFTGIAVGIAVQEGKLSLNEKVCDILKAEADAALASALNRNVTDAQVAHLKAVTVRDMLTMTCGHTSDPTMAYARRYALSMLPYITSDGIDVTGALNSLHLTAPLLFFAHPFNDAPGTNFTYNTLGSHILSMIVEKKTGEQLRDYLHTRLFKPLGLDKPAWDEVQGASAGGWGLHLNTDEMLRFGRLLLQGGAWEGRQLIPSAFLKDATRLQTRRREVEEGYQVQGYGFHIWIIPDGYMATGLFGQYIVVLPTKQAVIALSSDTPAFTLSQLPEIFARINSAAQSEAVLKLAWKHLLPAL